MKITATLNGIKVKKEVPVSYDDMTFKTFLALAPFTDDPFKVLSVLMDIKEETLRNVKIEGLETVLIALAGLKKPIEYHVPDKILGYAIPEDLGMQTMAQLQDLNSILEKYKGQEDQSEEQKKALATDLIKEFPLIIATYCMDYTQKAAWKEAEKLAPVFLDAPCMEVLAIGNFTCMKLIGLKMNKEITYHPGASRANKFRLVISVWLKRLAFTVRFYFWKRRLGTKEVSF